MNFEEGKKYILSSNISEAEKAMLTSHPALFRWLNKKPRLCIAIEKTLLSNGMRIRCIFEGIYGDFWTYSKYSCFELYNPYVQEEMEL